MIKRWPGWLNFLGLYVLYYIGFSIFIDIPFFKGEIFELQRAFHCCFFAGAYLAKWRFIDGEWKFR